MSPHPPGRAEPAPSDESILARVTGLGASLIVTERRAVIVREGAHLRPRHGVRGLPLVALRDVYLVAPRHGTGQIVLRTGPQLWQGVSLFVAAEHWRDAQVVVGELRARAAHAKRLARRSTSSRR